MKTKNMFFVNVYKCSSFSFRTNVFKMNRELKIRTKKRYIIGVSAKMKKNKESSEQKPSSIK